MSSLGEGGVRHSALCLDTYFVSFYYSTMNTEQSEWHHAPPHLFEPNCIYMITSGTYHKQHLFNTRNKLQMLLDVIFYVIKFRKWELRAWAIFSNHYHLITKSPHEGSIKRLVQHIHTESARKLNEVDGCHGRQVWFQYWDKCITFEKSYYPRLNYVVNNPVHHKLVPVARAYPFCSASWLESKVPNGFQKKVASFKCERLAEPDEFVPKWR